jgi:hypothetical protein
MTTSSQPPVPPDVIRRLKDVASRLERSAERAAPVRARVVGVIGGTATGVDTAMLAALDEFMQATRDGASALHTAIQKLQRTT